MLQFKEMQLSEIINHFARSEDQNERDLADILLRQEDALRDAQEATGTCSCGDTCGNHHCDGCTCWDD